MEVASHGTTFDIRPCGRLWVEIVDCGDLETLSEAGARSELEK